MRYLTVNEVIVIHEYLIDEFGGSSGMRDLAALESALARPQSGHYKNIMEESAALMESLAINHPFIDGNKRVSFFMTDVFLRLNGYFIDCDSQSAYNFFIELFESNNKFRFKYLLPWLEKHIKPINL
jgi:death-on-curing protein